MEAVVLLAIGLLLINLSGYCQGYYKQHFVVGSSWPIDRLVGSISLAAFFIVHKYAQAYDAIPFWIAAVGLGAYFHTLGAGQGRRAIDRLNPPTVAVPPEAKDQS